MGVRIDIDGPERAQFTDGDLVLYRDPEAYLAGADGHTAVCRVDSQTPDDVAEAYFGSRLALRRLDSGVRLRVDPVFVRRIDPAELMEDIDTAPLDGDAMSMESAATAWLRRQDGAL